MTLGWTEPLDTPKKGSSLMNWDIWDIMFIMFIMFLHVYTCLYMFIHVYTCLHHIFVSLLADCTTHPTHPKRLNTNHARYCQWDSANSSHPWLRKPLGVRRGRLISLAVRASAGKTMIFRSQFGIRSTSPKYHFTEKLSESSDNSGKKFERCFLISTLTRQYKHGFYMMVP